MTVQIERRRWTTEEYHKMVDAGVLNEDDNVELIDGEIITMAAIGSAHAACVRRLNQLFSAQVGSQAIVSIQDPITLDELSEPEPDVALLAPRDDFYSESHPQPEDILLIVEVADTPVTYDRDVKIPLYAGAGIPEVWLVDLTDEAVELYRSPVSGAYEIKRRMRAGNTLSPYAFDDIEIPIANILP